MNQTQPYIDNRSGERVNTVFLCFDTETTELVGNDLKPLQRQPRIIEFAAVLATVNNQGQGDIIDSIDILINPGFIITNETVKFTNITADMLIDKPFFANVAGDIEEFLLAAEAYVGQNVMFDVRAVTNEMRRINTNWHFPPRPRFCTIEGSEHIFGRRAKLSELHEHFFGKAHENAHRAMPDVLATLACFRELRKEGMI